MQYPCIFNIQATQSQTGETNSMMRKSRRQIYICSFCGKQQDQVQRLIAGPGGVYVCGECIAALSTGPEEPQEERGLRCYITRLMHIEELPICVLITVIDMVEDPGDHFREVR